MASESKDTKRIRADALRIAIIALIEKLIDVDVSEMSFEELGELFELLDKMRAKLKGMRV